jgi:CRISPR-associated protein (TIGR02584 family)
MLEPTVLFAPIGPYPAPLAALIWALARHRGLCPTEAFVVVDRRAKKYLEEELLGPGRVLAQLGRALGPPLFDESRLHVRSARRPDGSLVDDDLDPADAATYLDTLWAAARDAIACAGARRVVFALVAGNRRTVTAQQSGIFQLLARKSDLLFDVRVGDPRAEGAPEFFFPEQDVPVFRRGGAVIDARQVEVQLVELDLPRLAGLVGGEALGSYRLAKGASQKAIDAAAPPVLSIDLEQGTAYLDDALLDLSAAELLWYAYLARQRQLGDGWVVAGVGGHAEFRAFVVERWSRSWVQAQKSRPLRELVEQASVLDDDLRNLRGKTVQKVKRWCAAERPIAARLLVPEVDGRGRQRLPMAPASIALRG